MGGKKTMENSRLFEKVRRDKLNLAFLELNKLLPEYDPSLTLSKVKVLRRAAEYIRNLQKRNEEIIKLTSDSALKDESERLKKRVANLVLKTKELMDALRSSGINFPTNKPGNRKKKSITNHVSDKCDSSTDRPSVKCTCLGSRRKVIPLKEVNTVSCSQPLEPEKPSSSLITVTHLTPNMTGSALTSPILIPPSHPTSNSSTPLVLPLLKSSPDASDSDILGSLPPATSANSPLSSKIDDPNKLCNVVTASSSSTVPANTIIVSTPQSLSSNVQTNNCNLQSVPIISNVGSGTIILTEGRLINVPQIIPPILVKPQTVIVLPAAKRKEKLIMPKRREVTKTTYANKAPIPAIPPFRLETAPKILPKKKVKSIMRVAPELNQNPKKQKLDDSQAKPSSEKENNLSNEKLMVVTTSMYDDPSNIPQSTLDSELKKAEECALNKSSDSKLSSLEPQKNPPDLGSKDYEQLDSSGSSQSLNKDTSGIEVGQKDSTTSLVSVTNENKDISSCDSSPIIEGDSSIVTSGVSPLEYVASSNTPCSKKISSEITALAHSDFLHESSTNQTTEINIDKSDRTSSESRKALNPVGICDVSSAIKDSASTINNPEKSHVIMLPPGKAPVSSFHTETMYGLLPSEEPSSSKESIPSTTLNNLESISSEQLNSIPSSSLVEISKSTHIINSNMTESSCKVNNSIYGPIHVPKDKEPIQGMQNSLGMTDKEAYGTSRISESSAPSTISYSSSITCSSSSSQTKSHSPTNKLGCEPPLSDQVSANLIDSRNFCPLKAPGGEVTAPSNHSTDTKCSQNFPTTSEKTNSDCKTTSEVNVNKNKIVGKNNPNFNYENIQKSDNIFSNLQTFVGQDSSLASSEISHPTPSQNVMTNHSTRIALGSSSLSGAPTKPNLASNSCNEKLSVSFIANHSQSKTTDTSIQAGVPLYTNFSRNNVLNSIPEKTINSNFYNSGSENKSKSSQSNTHGNYGSVGQLDSNKHQYKISSQPFQSNSKSNEPSAPSSDLPAPINAISCPSEVNTTLANPNFRDYDNLSLSSFGTTNSSSTHTYTTQAFNHAVTGGNTYNSGFYPPVTSFPMDTTNFYGSYPLISSGTSARSEPFCREVPSDKHLPGIYTPSYLPGSSNSINSSSLPNDKNNLTYSLFCSPSMVNQKSLIFTQADTYWSSNQGEKQSQFNEKTSVSKVMNHSQLPVTSLGQTLPSLNFNTSNPQFAKSSVMSQTYISDLPSDTFSSFALPEVSLPSNPSVPIEKGRYDNSTNKNIAPPDQLNVFRAPPPIHKNTETSKSSTIPPSTISVNNFIASSISSVCYSRAEKELSNSLRPTYSTSSSYTHHPTPAFNKFQANTSNSNAFIKENNSVIDKHRYLPSSNPQTNFSNKAGDNNNLNYCNNKKDSCLESPKNSSESHNEMPNQLSSSESNKVISNDQSQLSTPNYLNGMANRLPNIVTKTNTSERSSVSHRSSYPNYYVTANSNNQINQNQLPTNNACSDIANGSYEKTHSLNSIQPQPSDKIGVQTNGNGRKDIHQEASTQQISLDCIKIPNSVSQKSDKSSDPKSGHHINYGCNQETSRSCTQSFYSQDIGNFKLPDPPIVAPCYTNFSPVAVSSSANLYNETSILAANNISSTGTNSNNMPSNQSHFKNLNKFGSFVPNGEKQKDISLQKQNTVSQSKLDINFDFLKSKDSDRNIFLQNGYEDLRFPSDFSSDLFNSLQVPGGGHQSESISPTAAFLLAFPLVSTSRNAENPNETENPDNQTTTPTTILQIGNIDAPSAETFHPIDFQKNLSKPSDHFDINNDYLQLPQIHEKENYKRCDKRKDTSGDCSKDTSSSKSKPEFNVPPTSYTVPYSNSLLPCNNYNYNDKVITDWQNVPQSNPKDSKKMNEKKKDKPNQKAFYNQNFQDCVGYKDKKRKQETRISVNWMTTPESRENIDFFSKEGEVQAGFGNIPLDFPSDSFPELPASRKTNNSSWSPSKSLLPSLDNHLLIPSTLPTLVGDLALGTNTPLESYKVSETPKSQMQNTSPKKNPEKLDESNKHNNFSKSPANFFSVSQLVDPKTKKQKIDRSNYRRPDKKGRCTNNKRKDDQCMYYGNKNPFDRSVPQYQEKRNCYKGGSYSAESLIGGQTTEMDFNTTYNYQHNSNYPQNDFSNAIEAPGQNYGYTHPPPNHLGNFSQEESQDFGFGLTHKSGRKESFGRESGSLAPSYHSHSKGINYNLPSSSQQAALPYTTTTLTNFNLSAIFPEMNDQAINSVQQRVSVSARTPQQQINPTFPNAQNFPNHMPQ